MRLGRGISGFAAIGLLSGLSACASGTPDAGLSDLSEVSSILAPESPEVPGKPVEAYTRIARGLKGCWLAPTAPLGLAKAYVYAAEAFPADKGGKAAVKKDVAALADKILALIDKEPLYYTDIAERFSQYDFRSVAAALGHLHAVQSGHGDEPLHR